MGREDWYRRTTWTPEDETAFRERLKRSRGDFHKRQHLSIQAGYLYGAGLYEPAATLNAEARAFPEESFDRTVLLLQQAEILAKLQRIEEMHAAYRVACASLAAEPGYISYVGLSWFRSGWSHADDALRVEIVNALLVDLHNAKMVTPGLAFHLATAFLKVNQDCGGSAEDIAMWARRALDAAGAEKSGLNKHPKLDLVPALNDVALARLRKLAR